MATALGRPEKASFLLVSFRHGDQNSPTYERYTDQVIEVDGHTSTPSMEVDIPENLGSFDETEAKVLLPIDTFSAAASSGLPHSPMFLQIDEVTAGLFAGDVAARKVLFRGKVTRTIKNYQGRNDTAAFFALPIKSRLDVPMGLQCNHHCYWRLFSRGCQLSQGLFQQFGEIASVDGKEVTITGANLNITAPSSPGGTVDRFWERGYLERDGLMIGVHIWVDTDPTIFVLRRRPPDSWILAGPVSIKFVPGCHKIITDCRNVWGNEEHFLGLGFAMLAYNPLFEDPQ